jgi:hypothetical protein
MMIYTRVSKSKPKNKTKAEREQYEKWLKSHQTPMKFAYAHVKKTEIKKPVVKNEQKIASLKEWVTGPLTKTGIMRDYHRLSISDREKIDSISKSVAPLHKSNYVYVSEGMNPASLGRKNEIL